MLKYLPSKPIVLAVLSLGWMPALRAAAPDASRDPWSAALQAGQAALAAQDYARARTEFFRLVTTPAAPPAFRSCAALLTAHSFIGQTNYPAARAEYEKIRAAADYPAHHRWEAEECLRELERTQAGLPARDAKASRVQLPKRPAAAANFFVAPGGADTNSGTQAQPLATPQQARDAIRALKRQGGLPRGGVIVNLGPGDYRLTETLKLVTKDSGTEASPIIYRAASPGTVRLTGGVRLGGFRPVTDPKILSRLPAEARGKVLELDVKACGVSDLGRIQPRGFGYSPSPVLELFFNGKAMPLARWPNQGFVRTGKVIAAGGDGGGAGAVFEYAGDRPARWLQAREAWLLGYWRYLWAEAALGLAAVDAQNHQLKLAQPYTYGGGIQADMPYYAFNLLEEIDTAGEWYLERGSGLLYFWPPGDPAAATIELSVLASPLVQMDGVAHVTWEGLRFELGRAAGVVIEGGERCLLSGCLLYKLGGDGVIIAGGSRHGVLGCDLFELGRGGVRVNGGDRQTLAPGGHFVENCHVYDFSRVDRTYTPAVWLEGVGNRIAHNRFHDSPGHAIRLEGNDHVLEFNDIHHVLLETDDQGGLDMHYNPTYRGNVVRYNFWHEIGSGGVPCGQAGVRLDDAISGVLIYGNVFQRCSRAQFGGVQIHGGKDNIVDNNLFIDCDYAVSFSPWGQQRWQSFLREAQESGRVITNQLYVARYPRLARLTENADVNSIWRNVVYRCGGFLTRDRNQQDLVDNWVTREDPGFVDADRQDYRLKPGAPATAQMGFRPIPFEEIGLYESPLRAASPPAR